MGIEFTNKEFLAIHSITLNHLGYLSITPSHSDSPIIFTNIIIFSDRHTCIRNPTTPNLSIRQSVWATEILTAVNEVK